MKKFTYEPCAMKLSPGTGSSKQPTFVAFQDDGFIALEIPSDLVPSDDQHKGSTGVLLRFKSAEGFQRFMVAAMETASLVWTEIAAEWNDEDTPQ